MPMQIPYFDKIYTASDGSYTTLPSDHDYTVLAVGNLNPYRFQQYIKNLRRPFLKICRLRFLNPDGSTAFALDSNANKPLPKTRTVITVPTDKIYTTSGGAYTTNPSNHKYTVLNNAKVANTYGIRTYRPDSQCFIKSGSLSVNMQNGQRRSVSVTLSNVDAQFDYNVNNLWFGQQIALDEGMILPDGTEYYIQQGIFLISTPEDVFNPNQKIITFSLVDKWANLDGTLGGNLDATHEVAAGTDIFSPVSAILAQDIGNGYKRDPVSPVYTVYYQGKTQTLPDGTTANLTDAPYTLTVDGNGGTEADVVLKLAEMLNAMVGYDAAGALRFEASQDDIDDATKPVLWTFSPEDTTLLGMTYSIKNTEVYNDYIVVGDQLDDYTQPSGRAQNLDPRSPTNINIIGRKTIRQSASGFATDQQCQDLAAWKLKRSTVLQKAVNISCPQILHLKENCLVEVARTDKPGTPIERHLIQSFSRPLTGTGTMTISCVSVQDFPVATVA